MIDGTFFKEKEKFCQKKKDQKGKQKLLMRKVVVKSLIMTTTPL